MRCEGEPGQGASWAPTWSRSVAWLLSPQPAPCLYFRSGVLFEFCCVTRTLDGAAPPPGAVHMSPLLQDTGVPGHELVAGVKGPTSEGFHGLNSCVGPAWHFPVFKRELLGARCYGLAWISPCALCVGSFVLTRRVSVGLGGDVVQTRPAVRRVPV